MKATFFMAQNKCPGCCFSCCNSSCEDQDSTRPCQSCHNFDCIHNRQSPKACDLNCPECPNVKCVDHARFNATSYVLKNC